MIKFGCVLKTSGDGYWSRVAKDVELTGIALGYINEEETFGELRVYFNNDSDELGSNFWDVNVDGLIYTDRLFLDLLGGELLGAGLNSIDVSYSEQGMQGDTYVSLDVGPVFLKSFKEIAVEEYTAAM
jgi:hypothetical protein